MKIEQLIAHHLFSAKHVTLQGIGTIHLNPDIVIQQDNEKDMVLPDNAYTFEYNLKAGEDEKLIATIIQHTKKIMPLASADLESFTALAKQFLNIGKPFTIEGVGTILKKQDGDYEFIPGTFTMPKLEEAPRQLKEKNEEKVSFERQRQPNMESRKYILFGLMGALILLFAFAIYYFGFRNHPTNVNAQTTPVTPTVDTIRKDTLKTDSLPHPAADSLHGNAANPNTSTDSSTFKIIIKEFPTLAIAQKTFGKYTSYGHKVVLLTIDSTHYQIAMPFTTPLTDTSRAKDSLKRFFQGNPKVLLKHN